MYFTLDIKHTSGDTIVNSFSVQPRTLKKLFDLFGAAVRVTQSIAKVQGVGHVLENKGLIVAPKF